MSGTSIAPAIPSVGSSSKPPYYDPNQHTPNVLNAAERSNRSFNVDNSEYDAENPYIPLSLAELRIQSLMTDLKNMKADHLGRLEKLRDNYEEMLRSRHQDAKSKIDEARKLLLDQMAEIAKLTQERKMRDQFMENRTKDYENQLKDTKAELHGMNVKLDATVKQLKDKEDLIKVREREIEKKAKECAEVEKNLKAAQEDRAEIERQRERLETALATSGGASSAIGAGGASSESLHQAQTKVIELEKELAVLKKEKEVIVGEVELLRKAGPGKSDGDEEAQRKILQATLDELRKSNDAMIAAQNEKTTKLIADVNRDRDEALVKQRDFYDKMIEQMVRLGEEEEKAKEREKAATVNLTDIEDARRAANAAEEIKAVANNERSKVAAKLAHCVDRLEEIEALIKKNDESLTQEIEPNLNLLEQQVSALRAEADEANRDRERVSQYTHEDTVAAFDKLGIPFNEVTPQIITTLMQACNHGELLAAQLAEMAEKKAEILDLQEKLKEKEDEAAKAKLVSIHAQFKASREKAQSSKNDASSAMHSLGLDPKKIQDEEFRGTAEEACKMWREIMLNAPAKSPPPQDLVEQLARFNLTPEMMTHEKVEEIRPFLDMFPEFGNIIKDFKAQKERRVELRDLIDGDLNNKLEAAREAMSVASATGENVDQAAAILDDATAQMAQAQQEVEQLEASVVELDKLQRSMLRNVQEKAQSLGVSNDEMKFHGVKNGKELKAVIDAWDQYQASIEDHGPIQRHDADLPTGPSPELLAELEAIRARKKAIAQEQAKLEKEREGLQKDDDDYRRKQYMLDMEAINADRSWREARKRLQAAQQSAAAAAGEPAPTALSDDESDEQDLTNGVAIKLSSDIATANKQLIRLADELESLKAKLRAAWQERDRLIEELNSTKSRHSQDLAKARAEAEHYQKELVLKMEEFKVTAGTHYAKFGIAGINYQTQYAERLSAISQESDPHTAYRDLIFELEKSRDEAAERANNLRIRLEQGGVSAADAAAASGSVLGAGQTAVSNAELDALRRELAEAKASKVELEKIIEGLRAQLKVAQESSGSQSDLQAKLIALTGESSEASARASRLQEEKDQLQREQSQLNSAKAEIESQCMQLQGQVKQLDASLSQSETKCKEFEKEVARLESELSSLNEQLAAVKKEHEAQVAALKADHEAKLESQAIEFNGQLTVVGAERDEAKAALGSEVEAKVAALAESEKRGQTIEELNAAAAEKELIIGDLRQKYLDEIERRKKFQQDYEGLKGSIRVYCRVRPFIRNEIESPDENARIKCISPGPNTWTCILKSQRQGLSGVNITEEPKSFDHVFLSDFGERFDNGSQSQVFTECECFADMAFDGLNTCIFAYGQSGSGKTWTMRGDPGNPQLWGLKPRMIYHMYSLKEAGKMAYDATIKCSMYEIYNNQIYDILDRYEKVLKWEKQRKACFKCFEQNHSFIDCKNCAKCHQPGHNFSLCSAKQKGQLYIDRFSALDKDNATEEEKKSMKGNSAKTLTAKILGDKVKIEGLIDKAFDTAAEMFEYVDKAEILRRVRATGLNDESSRSHLVFTMYVERKSLKPKANQPRVTIGKLSLCDLAGSERADRVQLGPYVTPEDKAAMLEEGKAINTSLSALTAIFNILGNPESRKNTKLDYRSTMLTTVMRDSIGGSARTLMFVNVSPSLINLEETKGTLGYGNIVKNITNLVATVDTGADELREEVEALKAKLAKYEGDGASAE